MSFLLGAVEGLSTWFDCERPWRELNFGLVSVSASDAACGFNIGVADFPERISSLRGDAGENGGSRERTLCALPLRDSGSSGIVSLDKGRVVLAVLRDATLSGGVTSSVDVVDTVARDDGRAGSVEDVAGRGRVEGLAGVLAVLARDDRVEGLLGGAEAAVLLPNVVRRVVAAVFSRLDPGLAVLELKEEAVGVLALDKRLFSSLDAASSAGFAVVVVVGFRTAEETGRVGGLVMVVPFARAERALVRLAVGVDSRSVTDILFLASSPVVALLGVAVPVAGALLAGFLSIFPLLRLDSPVNPVWVVTASGMVV